MKIDSALISVFGVSPVQSPAFSTTKNICTEGNKPTFVLNLAITACVHETYDGLQHLVGILESCTQYCMSQIHPIFIPQQRESSYGGRCASGPSAGP